LVSPSLVSVYEVGNEPGVQKMEISQAGSSQHKQRLRVTNVIAHGPGIKLLDGLAQASTNGDTTYAYRCRAPFSTTRTPTGQSESSSLFLLWPAGQLWILLEKEGWLRHQLKVAKPPKRRRRGGQFGETLTPDISPD